MISCKKFLLKLDFEEDGLLYANFLFYIHIIYRKLFDCQCLGRGIRMYFPILEGIENGSFYSSITSYKRVKIDGFES